MPRSPSLVIETRPRQMFPVLDQAEVDRLRRFGSLRSFAAGEALVQWGGPGEHRLFENPDAV